MGSSTVALSTISALISSSPISCIFLARPCQCSSGISAALFPVSTSVSTAGVLGTVPLASTIASAAREAATAGTSLRSRPWAPLLHCPWLAPPPARLSSILRRQYLSLSARFVMMAWTMQSRQASVWDFAPPGQQPAQFTVLPNFTSIVFVVSPIFDRLWRIVILAEVSSLARSGIPIHWLSDSLDAKGQRAVHPQRFFPSRSFGQVTRSYVCVRFEVLQTVHGMRRKDKKA